MILTLIDSKSAIVRVRENLILARLYKQKAQVYIDFKMNTDIFCDLREDQHLIRLLSIAKLCRKTARNELVRLEKQAGKTYCQNGTFYSSAQDLSGYVFRSWPEYKTYYNDGELDIWV